MSDKIKLQLQEWSGYSAYEVAVQNGFTGTQKEWLESLKGGELQITVCGKNVDENGNIVLLASDIKMVDGGLYTVGDKITELENNKVNKADIVNGLNSDAADKPLSAAQGKALKVTALKKAELFMAEVTIPASGWSASEPYTQEIAVEGITAESGALLTDYPDGGTNEEAFADCALKLVGRGENAITVRVDALPDADFKANLLVLIPGVSE